jgi:hypothetical protein
MGSSNLFEFERYFLFDYAVSDQMTCRRIHIRVSDG